MKSISRRLLVLLLSALTVAALLSGISAYLKSHEEVSEFFDYQLQQMALILQDQNSFEHRPKEVSEFEKDEGVVVQVWHPAGNLLYQSVPDLRLPLAPRPGLQSITVNNREYRVFLLTHGDRTVQVSQSSQGRRETSFHFVLGVLIPLFYIFTLLALIIWLIVRSTLNPLTTIANGVAQLSPGALEPLPEADLPAEILPLVQKLNGLFDQLSHAFDIQQRFVADAAHELRTPLTAVKLQVRILERCSSDDERVEALGKLKAGVDRAARLAGQLLVLARVEPEAPHAPLAAVSLNGLISQILTEQSRIARERGVDLVTGESGAVTVSGEPDALRAMISNLVDNAVRYSPAGGTVTVDLSQNRNHAVITVTDSGPGIAPLDRERVFDRFYRGSYQDSTGSGLGLAIVKSAAIRHGGCVRFADNTSGTGLSVIVELPLTAYH